MNLTRTADLVTDQELRLRLYDALGNRRWTPFDSERAAAFVAGLYQAGEGDWKVWPTKKVMGPDHYYHYRVARRESNAVCVYDSPQEGRARDVAHALNEVERNDSDSSGTL